MVDERIIIALDTSEKEKIDKILKNFENKNLIFKVGLQLFNKMGPEIIKRIKKSGNRVFLDLKLFDIPNTMIEAAKEMALNGVELFTVHLLNGRNSLKKLRYNLKNFCDEKNIEIPKIVGVTVLTSFSEENFHITFGGISIEKMVTILVTMAHQADVKYFVSSPKEIKLIKTILPDSVLITPGIRPKDYIKDDDQKRVMTPEEAISLGANYLVIGRPIIKSDNMLKSYGSIVKEIKK